MGLLVHALKGAGNRFTYLCLTSAEADPDTINALLSTIRDDFMLKIRELATRTSLATRIQELETSLVDQDTLAFEEE